MLVEEDGFKLRAAHGTFRGQAIDSALDVKIDQDFSKIEE